MLYPVTNAKRITTSLHGLWDFQFVDLNYVPIQPLTDKRLIGVPSSYNDLFTSHKDRDHFGKVVYERQLDIPSIEDGSWRIRIGSAGNRVTCYLNGTEVFSHNGGFLPLDFEIPQQYHTDSLRLSIVLDNRLDYQTYPSGEIKDINGTPKQVINYDFYNYVGLHRDVHLYHLPNDPIDDIIITTSLEDDVKVSYQVITESTDVTVAIIDPLGMEVATTKGAHNTVVINNPILWDVGQGNLYTLRVQTPTDVYEEEFGIRDIKVQGSKLLLNNKPVYLKGFGMHEDHVTIGKGSISALNIRDMNLLQWIGANSFRTSHYPYDEEMYTLADKLGILIINEMPAVGLNFWSSDAVFTPEKVNKDSQVVYQQQLTELIQRDKNHPSVIMYSLANEANTHEAGALAFFEPLFAHARTLTDLPLMIVEWVGAKENKVAHLADVIGVNRYIGWYVDFADMAVIRTNLQQNLEDYFNKYHKPIVLSEFGADTIAGLHKLPSVAFSEEFQVEFIKEYLAVISELDYVVGEHIWNFADFMTKQGLTRIDGNKKGVFTRDRQPKMVAHFLRDYWSK